MQALNIEPRGLVGAADHKLRQVNLKVNDIEEKIKQKEAEMEKLKLKSGP
jgi:hypothetical protein